MRANDPIGRDVRKARRLRQLGDERVCVLCGKRTPAALKRVNRSLLESHHLGGRANDASLVVTVCGNCHDVLTEAQRDSAIDLRHETDRSSLEQLEAVLRGLADFFDQLATSLRRRANELAEAVSLLDHNHPGWRDPK